MQELFALVLAALLSDTITAIIIVIASGVIVAILITLEILQTTGIVIVMALTVVSSFIGEILLVTTIAIVMSVKLLGDINALLLMTVLHVIAEISFCMTQWGELAGAHVEKS